MPKELRERLTRMQKAVGIGDVESFLKQQDEKGGPEDGSNE